MKWFPMPQAVLRSKWDVYKEPKHMRTSINLSFGLWQTLVVAHPMSNSSTPTPSCLLAPPFSSNDHRMCLRKACPQPQLQGYFLVCLSQWQWSHFSCRDLDVGAWNKSAPMRYEVSLLSLEGSSDVSWFSKGPKEVFTFLPVGIVLSGLMLRMAAVRLWWKQAWR